MRRSLQKHRRGLPIASLPRTLRDAVLVAQKLDVPYIWIDALCIIQDSRADWVEECEHMGEYYNNARLTISALQATESGEGFLEPREALAPRGALASPMVPLHPAAWDNVWLRRPPPQRHDVFQVAPLNTRGWTFQERLLSTRVLHFGACETYWECETVSAREGSTVQDSAYEAHSRGSNFVEGEDFKRSLSRYGSAAGGRSSGHGHHSVVDGGFALWYRLLTHFSQRALTRLTDKLPAIDGVAKKISQITGSAYMGGVFADDPAGLCWNTGEGRDGSVYMGGLSEEDPAGVSPNINSKLAPSWSWACVSGKIEFPFAQQAPILSASDAVVVGISERKEGRALTLDCWFKRVGAYDGYHLDDTQGVTFGTPFAAWNKDPRCDRNADKLVAIRICKRQYWEEKAPDRHALGNCGGCSGTGEAIIEGVYFLLLAPVRGTTLWARVALGLTLGASSCMEECYWSPTTSERGTFEVI